MTEPPSEGSPPSPQRRGPTDLGAWRAELQHARSGRALLDALLSPHDAGRLVSRLPVEDLHLYVRQIGLADAPELLALASGEQVRGILDAEIWEGDRPTTERLDPWLGALMHAGPLVMYRRLLEVDDALLNWIVRRSVRVQTLDDPEDFDPPDVEHVVTPDGRLCVCFPESAERDMPVKLFLDMLMRDDPAFCINLLVFAEAALDSVLEEDAFRWRSGRMADRGYVDPVEALAIYAPPPPLNSEQTGASDQVRAASRFVAPVVDAEARLAAAFDVMDADDREPARASLAYASNMALSADRVELWDLEAQEAVLKRVRAGLVLGLDRLAGPGADARADAEVLGSTPMAVTFRVGYQRMQAAVAPLRKALSAGWLAGPAGRLDGLDLPRVRSFAEALAARHPALPNGAPPRDADGLARMATAATLLAELGRVAAERPREIGIGAWLFTRFARDVAGLDAVGPLPADRADAVIDALFADGALRPEARSAAEAWWTRLGGTRADALAVLLDEAVRQLGRPSDRPTTLLWVA